MEEWADLLSQPCCHSAILTAHWPTLQGTPRYAFGGTFRRSQDLPAPNTTILLAGYAPEFSRICCSLRGLPEGKIFINVSSLFTTASTGSLAGMGRYIDGFC